MTNADRIRAMTDEELAGFLSSISDLGIAPWSTAFSTSFCDSCPNPEYTTEDGLKLRLHECEFSDGVCPHGDEVLWWLRQPAGKEAANG